MIYTSDYDATYIPSVPVVEVEIKDERHAPGVKLTAIVDSGADATIVPMRYLRQIQARVAKRAYIRGVAQQRVRVEQYAVWLQVGNHRPMRLLVVGDAQGKEALLGRDVLNQFIVTLNGLASVVEISD